MREHPKPPPLQTHSKAFGGGAADRAIAWRVQLDEPARCVVHKTPIQLSYYRLGLPSAGSLILLVNEFSSDHTQGSSAISTPGRNFMIL